MTNRPCRSALSSAVPWKSTGAPEPEGTPMTIPSNRATSREAVPSMADKAALIDILCGAARILPVITIEREQDALPLADALAAGGLRTLEVTLRSEHGLSAIRILREQRPELCVGAGTVLDEWMLAEAEAAGSQFIVTP